MPSVQQHSLEHQGLTGRCNKMDAVNSVLLSNKKKNRLAILEQKQQQQQKQKACPSPFACKDTASSPSQGLKNQDPVYAPLCKSVLNGSLASQFQVVENNQNAVKSLLCDLLHTSRKAPRDMHAVLDQVQNKVVQLDNPSTRGVAADRARERAQRQLGLRSRKHLSLRKHRKMGLFHLAKRDQKYEIYLPLHEMWKLYAAKLLSGSSDVTIESRILAADLHGAFVTVLDSKINSLVGIQGVMVRETENTFGIITKDDKLHVVPKKGSIFVLQVGNLNVTLFGNMLSMRSFHSKANKKLNATIEL